MMAFLAAGALLCQSQPPSLKPAPVRATLSGILEVLDEFPHSGETAETVAGIRKSATWLMGRLRDDRTPAAYGRHLERSLALLREAVHGGPARQAEALRYIGEDLKLKHSDCKQFGMGRLVKLEVRTVKDGRQTGGWQVFYRWVPSRAVGEVRPLPFPLLSSPTSTELPPGAYTVQADKTVDGSRIASAELAVPVGGTKAVVLEIPVP